jgi:hypothetical protein
VDQRVVGKIARPQAYSCAPLILPTLPLFVSHALSVLEQRSTANYGGHWQTMMNEGSRKLDVHKDLGVHGHL